MIEPALAERAAAADVPAVAKPRLTYKVICISAYHADLASLDDKVATLRRGGLRRVSRSELIRIAVAAFDADAYVAAHGDGQTRNR